MAHSDICPCKHGRMVCSGACYACCREHYGWTAASEIVQRDGLAPLIERGASCAAARGEGDRPTTQEHNSGTVMSLGCGEGDRPAERHAFYPTTVNGGGKVACGVWLPTEGRMCKRSESDPIHSGEGGDV